MRIPSGVVDQYVYFVGVDATDLKTRETGLTTFTVYRSRNGGAAAAMTTPTINETDATNMPGVYELLLDEDMTIDAGDDSQEMVFHITHAGMAPVTRTIELYRPKITAGETLTVASGLAEITAAQIDQIVDEVWDEDATGHQTSGTFGQTVGDSAGGDSIRTLANGVNTTLNLVHGLIDADTAQAGAAGTITLQSGSSADDDFYNNTLIWISGGTGANQARFISDYVGSTKVATVNGNWVVTPDVTSTYSIFAFGALPGASAPTAGEVADAVWDELQSGHVGAGTFGEIATEVASILVDTAEIGTAGAGLTNINLPNQTMDIVGSITGNLSGSVGSVTGAVGSVTGNVGGTINGLTATALADFFDTDSGTTYASAVAGSVVKEIADNAGGSALTEAGIADAVWDEVLSGHAGAGSTGEALAAAGTAGDPWITALPGAYGAGTAGKIIGDNINATISSRATQTSVDTVDGIIDSILVDTAEIGTAGAGLTALATQASVNTIDDFLDTEVAAILAAVDTEVAAILADTNELQTDWANGGRLDLILDARASQASVDTVDGIVDAIVIDTAEIGMAGAGLTALATQASVDTVDANVDSILADTGTDGVVVAAASKTGYTLSATGSAALTEGYATDGATATMAELLYMIWAMLAEKSVASTTLTAKKLDGSTSAMTFTLNDATTPTSITRAT
jgi:hypothetical protein